MISEGNIPPPKFTRISKWNESSQSSGVYEFKEGMNGNFWSKSSFKTKKLDFLNFSSTMSIGGNFVAVLGGTKT